MKRTTKELMEIGQRQRAAFEKMAGLVERFGGTTLICPPPDRNIEERNSRVMSNLLAFRRRP